MLSKLIKIIITIIFFFISIQLAFSYELIIPKKKPNIISLFIIPQKKPTVVQKQTKEITKLEFKDPKNILISNVTGKEVASSSLLKDLLIKQIESRVRWRESVMFMINKGVNKFIEIGPGKVLSGLIKRIDKNVKVSAINNEEDIKLININD